MSALLVERPSIARSEPLPGEIDIVIAEDHRIVADGIATMLSFEEEFRVCAIVPTGEELLDVVERQRPAIALVDVNLAGPLDGIEAISRMTTEEEGTRAIALTMFTDNNTVARAVSAGALGYLPKNIRGDELVQAVRAVAAGKGFLHPDVARPLMERSTPAATDRRLESLTPRERDVLQQLAVGGTTRELAQALGVGEETVKSHLSSIYSKLGASDRTAAVVIAMRHGLMH
ncbi:MAG: response regulator [Egibacteraceae bacterium]